MLRTVSKRIFENVSTDENARVDNILSLCNNPESKLEEGIEILEKPVNASTNKQAIDCLNDNLEKVKMLQAHLANYHRQYHLPEIGN